MNEPNEKTPQPWKTIVFANLPGASEIIAKLGQESQQLNNKALKEA